MEETKTIAKPANDEGEFLTELVDRYNHWTAKNNEYGKECALAYRRLIFAFTTPPDKKDQ